MLTHLSATILVSFLLTVALTFFLFVNATKNKIATVIFFLAWLAITGILSFQGFFQKTDVMPPRLGFVMLPALVFILILLVSKSGRNYTDGLNLQRLTLVHIVRIPVEIILYLLAADKFVPELMTFAGRNFDILSGITAPIVYLTCFQHGRVRNRTILLIWNFVCLALLLNIVINAILSAPFPFQQFAFEQPNVVIFYFPFTWLPSFIVLIVLYSQLASIRLLLKRRNEE